MLTLVPNLADGYLSGQRRSPLSILLVQLPHWFPLGMCFAATEFRLNRLRRWPSSSLNPLVGFQNSACMMHAFSLAAQPNTQSQLSIVNFQHDCPLHNSLCKLWTQGSYKLRPFQHTARSGNIWSHFSVNSLPLWWRLLLPSSLHCRLAFPPHFCRSLCPASKPICRRRSQMPRLLCSACSPRIVTHSRRLWIRFEVYTQPAGFLTKQATRSGIHSSQASKDARSQTQANTRTLPTSRFPNGECSLQNKAKWYNDNIPINATHSNLPITLQLALI